MKRLLTATLCLGLLACGSETEPPGGGTDTTTLPDITTPDTVELEDATGDTTSDVSDTSVPDVPDVPEPDVADVGDVEDSSVPDVPDVEEPDEGGPPDVPDAGPDTHDAGPDVEEPECVKHTDCEADDLCTIALCVTGECTTAAAACDDGEACTTDTCEPDSGCVHAWTDGEGCAGATVLLEATFDDGTAAGFTITDLADNLGDGETPATWVPDPDQVHSGAGALYFGIPGPYHYDTGKVVAASATTPEIEVPAGSTALLRLQTWLDVEPEPAWDVVTISVLNDASATPAWSKPADAPAKGWFPIEVDLTAFAGTTIRIVLTFNSVDPTVNASRGAFVDTVRVLSFDGARACDDAAGCDDGIDCTTDSCEEGTCTYAVDATCCVTSTDCFDGDACTVDLCTPQGTCENKAVANPECCNTDADCEDNNACTADVCGTTNTCTHEVVDEPGCCATESDCDDSDQCTIDSCSDNICGYVNTCCQSDDECDDGDDVCTEDACLNGACVFDVLPIPGCCEPIIFEELFSSPLDIDWTLQATSLPCQWSVVTDGKTQSLPGSLYYGDPNLKDTVCNTNEGSALSPEITIPDKAGPTLEFDYWLDTDFTDEFSVDIIDGEGKVTTILAPNPFGALQQTWLHHSSSLAAFKGQTIQVRFNFAGYGFEPFGAPYEGVYVDDLKITDPCE